MPTARELLEQADALMRRNRAAAVDDIPVLTDSVAVPAGMPPVAAAAATPAFSGVPSAPAAPRAPEHVPTLTEAVAASGDRSVDSVIQEGEPSDWLDLDSVDPSVIGGAPDSIAIVPLVARPRAPAADVVLSDDLEEIELTTPAEQAFDDEFDPADTHAGSAAVRPDAGPAPDVAAAPSEQAVPDAWFAPPGPVVETRSPRPDPETYPMSAPFAEPLAADSDAQTVAITATQPTAGDTGMPSAAAEAAAVAATTMASAEEATAGDRVASVAMAPMEEPTALDMPESDASPPRDAAFPAADVAAPPAATVAADDAEKWDAIAEEIRMQVLQRIDLFTDTGLREQLGMRLQPIVDRASADLVATINLHVGELLRAYVAEAIEREIENWRNNH